MRRLPALIAASALAVVGISIGSPPASASCDELQVVTVPTALGDIYVAVDANQIPRIYQETNSVPGLQRGASYGDLGSILGIPDCGNGDINFSPDHLIF